MTQPGFDDAMGVGQGRLAITLNGEQAYLTAHIKLSSSGAIVPNSLLVIDIPRNTATVLATATDGIFTGVALKPGRAYISTVRLNKGEVTVVDTQHNSIDGDPIQLGFGRPCGIAISSNGRAYVPDCFKSVVHVVDIQQRKVLPEREIQIDRTEVGRPARIAMSSNGRQAYVTTMRFSTDTQPHKIVIFDTETDTPIGDPIAVGRTPIDIAAENTGDRVYVVNRDSNSVTRIRRSGTITTTTTTDINVGEMPLGVAVGSDGRILVTSRDDETVTLVDADQQQPQILAVEKIGPEPSGIAVSADGKSTLVAVSSPAAFATLKRPEVTRLDPTEGKKGDPLTVLGKNVGSPGAVKFEGKPAQIVSAAADRVQVKVPEGAVDVVDVVVLTGGGESQVTPGSQFTYLPRPVVRELSATQGKKGDQIRVIGENLGLEPRDVNFDNASAGPGGDLGFGSRLLVTVPDGSGAVDVTVTTRGGTSEETDGSKFTYV